MKDLTKIKTPFGLLGKKTRNALVAHFEAGGGIEFWSGGVWYSCVEPHWIAGRVYRANPANSIDELSSMQDAVFKTVLACDGLMRRNSHFVRECKIEPVGDGITDATDAIQSILDPKPPQPHPIFAAVKEWQEAREGADWERLEDAVVALKSIKVPE